MFLLLKFGVVALLKRLGSVNNSQAAVILARYSSSRLPGKALMEIAGKPVLQHIVDRLKSLLKAEQIILATSDLPSDDALEDFAAKAGIACYRGSLERVGERFYAAAKQTGCDYAMRINGDNIFLDPALVEHLMQAAATGQYRFLSNVKGRSFPKGMSVEMVEMDFYQQKLEDIKADPYCNEHVMVCLYEEEAPADHYYWQNDILPEAAGIQLALDTPEDFERSRYMLEQMPAGHYDLNTTFEYYRNYEESLKR